MTRTDTQLRIGPETPRNPTDLLEQARAEARRREEEDKLGARVARRLLLAFIACLIIGVLCFVVVPNYAGITIPPIVPLLSFGAIAAGALVTMPRDESAPKGDARDCDEGNPIGCCPGPRPLRTFRDER
ncbi:MAG: hypothetical protein RIB60_05095 [Phycisphaerales bacterium]